jgi:ankyrin repeat protein
MTVSVRAVAAVRAGARAPSALALPAASAAPGRASALALLVVVCGAQQQQSHAACAAVEAPSGEEDELLLAHVYAGNARTVAQLLAGRRRAGQGSADVNAVRNADGWTPLLLAASQGHTDIVALLLAAGADVEARLGGEDTPLALAAMHGHAQTVVLLAQEGGAAVDARRASNGATALMLAAALGHEAAAEALLALGADCELKDADGATALQLAAR